MSIQAEWENDQILIQGFEVTKTTKKPSICLKTTPKTVQKDFSLSAVVILIIYLFVSVAVCNLLASQSQKYCRLIHFDDARQIWGNKV